MNYYSYSAFKIIEKELKDKIIGCRINNITIINSTDFLLTLSLVKEEKLLVSLNHHHPFACLINVEKTEPTLAGSLNENLRKYLRDAYIVSIDLDNHDRIMHCLVQKANDCYEKEQRHVYFEFISQRANMIITDDKQLILFALHFSPLTSVRPILSNLVYAYPSTFNLTDEEEPSIIEIKEEAIKYYGEALKKHKKEKFLPLYRYLKSRIKALDRKCNFLKTEINNANIHLVDVNHGNAILSMQNDKENLDIYVKENNLFLNESQSLVANANMFFKKYKKSKRTIEMATIEIEKAQKENEYLTYLLASSQYMNDDELLSLLHELMPKQQVKKKIQTIKCSYIVCQNTKIFFGKNASSNNELTFHIASKDDYFLHIKDYHGAHVIIHYPQPSNDVKLVAAEMCLILSNKSAGEVMISSLKNVKKGHALGEAILLNYELIVLKNVRESTFALLKHKADY